MTAMVCESLRRGTNSRPADMGSKRTRGTGRGQIMREATISYHGADLCAWEHEGQWTVRLGAFEASSGYLDLALAEVLDNGEAVHELAAKLLVQFTSKESVGAGEAVAA